MADRTFSINVTTSSPKRVSVSSQQVANEITAGKDLTKYYSELAKNWAISSTIVENIDYSAKYYSELAKNSEIYTKGLFEDTQNVYAQFEELARSSIEELNAQKSTAINDLTVTLENTLSQGETEVSNIINDGKTEVNSIVQSGITAVHETAKTATEDIEGLSDEIKNNAEEILSRSLYKLFQPIVFDHILTYKESQGLALQGTYVYKEAIAGSRYGYPDFYAKCVEEYDEAASTETINGVTVKVNSNGHKFYDIADKGAIDSFFNTMGIAWFYGVDVENERIFLPRNNYATSYIENGNKLVSVYGSGKALGLTNGKHNYGAAYISSGTDRIITDTRNYNSSVGTITGSETGTKPTDYQSLGISTDASSSGITGRVNLQNTQNGMYLYICVGNTTNYEGVTEVVNQGMEILEQVAQKVNVDGSNAEFPYITETYRNGQSWYRVYSDGWCEQGGQVIVSNGTSGYAVALLKPVMHYNVLLTMATNAYATTGWGVASKTSTQFSIFCNINTDRNCAWRADGWLYKGD